MSLERREPRQGNCAEMYIYNTTHLSFIVEIKWQTLSRIINFCTLLANVVTIVFQIWQKQTVKERKRIKEERPNNKSKRTTMKSRKEKQKLHTVRQIRLSFKIHKSLSLAMVVPFTFFMLLKSQDRGVPKNPMSFLSRRREFLLSQLYSVNIWKTTITTTETKQKTRYRRWFHDKSKY